MPITVKEFNNIKERKIKSDSNLLGFMDFEENYTTNDIQKFLEINHTATLQRLKKLNRQGYLELVVTPKRNYRWKKIKDIEEKEDVTGYMFY